ncbi:SusC/RagA family TonB-linked outer membrane protein [Algibacter lectus]|uniref:SusC/RagA family TonB-linked outer membrane protein n=1 Tax=Algibacter lectus TaxID=221126 RepID=UPI00069389FF|nr:SusC/RagA family TonB-linked outer membrane protein [Algibacter lectus]
MKKFLIYTFLVHCFVLQSFAQSAITGTVTENKNNEPITGATVIINGTNQGAVTDFDGKFTLNNVKDNATLSVRFMGYFTKEIKVNGQSTFSIVLEEDFQSLDEIVVVGYGTQTKRDLTGSVASVKTEDINKAPTSNFDQALSGRIAGVQVTSADGTPGSAANIVIRGGNSITSDNTPLYVIDGVPLTDFDPSSLNTNDIESFDVLKDASATAIYGSRGANGVIVINTKGGRSDGKTDVSLNINSGLQYVPSRLQVMSPYQYVSNLQKQALIADNYNPGNTYDDFLRIWEDPELYRNAKGTDWQDEVFRLASFQDYNFSVSGGGEATQFYYSGQHVNQDGIVINTGFNKTVSNLRVKHKVSDKFNLDVNLVYSISNQLGSSVSGNGYSGNIIRDVLVFRPVEPINDDGNIGFDLEDDTNRYLYNPVDNLNNTDRRDRRELFRGTIRATNKFSNELSLNVVGSFQSQNRRSSLFSGADTYYGARGSDGISGNITSDRSTVASGSTVLTYKPKTGRLIN